MRTTSGRCLTLVAVVAASLVGLSTPATAGEDPSLCNRQDGADIPSDYFVSACYDGNNIILENHSTIVVRANTTPYVSPATRWPTGAINTFPSQVAIDWDGFNRQPDPYLLPPETRLVIPTGAAGNEINIELWDHQDVYAIADLVDAFLPVSASSSIVDFINDASPLLVGYVDCLAANNFIGDVACGVEANARLTAATLANFGADILRAFSVTELLGVLLGGFQLVNGTVGATGRQLDDINSLIVSNRVIHVAPHSAPPSAPPPSPAGPSQPPPAPSDPQPQPPPPTQPPSPTGRAETTGGTTHTWTNYTNAGGYEGPTIPSNTTVLIACRLTGFAVADGNTWWYRIAQSPWNGAYYASADAFYNNGQTSGSLHGTPFVDEAVPTC